MQRQYDNPPSGMSEFDVLSLKFDDVRKKNENLRNQLAMLREKYHTKKHLGLETLNEVVEMMDIPSSPFKTRKSRKPLCKVCWELLEEASYTRDEIQKPLTI